VIDCESIYTHGALAGLVSCLCDFFALLCWFWVLVAFGVLVGACRFGAVLCSGIVFCIAHMGHCVLFLWVPCPDLIAQAASKPGIRFGEQRPRHLEAD
jgi:hypothetical protein